MSNSSVFDLPEYEAYKAAYTKRVTNNYLNTSYYDGSVYKSKQWMGFNSLFPRLYKNIKPLYLPLARAVNTDVGLIPGGWKLHEDSEPYQDAVNQIFRWSSWQTDGVLYIHNGAVDGVSGIKILMNEQRRTVSMMPITIAEFIKPSEDLAIEVDYLLDNNGDRFEYAVVYTPSEIATFKDGNLFDFDGDRTQIRPNPLGFVPFLEIPHIREKRTGGSSTFDKVMPMLNEVNNLASHLATMIERHGEPQWAGIGIEDASDMQKSGESMWFVENDKARIEPIVAKMDVPGALSFIQSIETQVKEGLPELAFDELRKGQIATETVKLQLAELEIKINRIRPNYDNGLLKALRMCGLGLILMGQTEIGNQLIADDLMIDDKRDILPRSEKESMELEIMSLQLEAMKTPINESILTVA